MLRSAKHLSRPPRKQGGNAQGQAAVDISRTAETGVIDRRELAKGRWAQ